MMDWTDRHYRYFMRQITRRTLLYSEMITTAAILRGDRARLLDFSEPEHPLALHLGGDDPRALAECAAIAEGWGYDEVNLNVGCPSDRVQKGSFGACLMASPARVAAAVAAMKQAVSLPVTVKHRIGIDDLDSYNDLANFVGTVAAAGADRFSVHARKAWLKGLSPRQNRSLPPLRYQDVYRLKKEFPELVIEINGGILTLLQAREHLQRVDGAMLGRAAYDNPYLFAAVDGEFYGEARKPASRREVVLAMADYMGEWQAKGVYPKHISRHLLGLFNGQAGAKAWKRHISENAHKPGTDASLLIKAAEGVPAGVLDALPAETAPGKIGTAA